MKILIQRTKWGDQYWNATEPSQRLACIREMFKTNDSMGFYASLKDGLSEMGSIYAEATSGNVGAMGKLLTARKDYEYEGWEIVEVSEA